MALGPWVRSLGPAVVLALIGLGLYANALTSPFIYDDIPAIVDNPDIRQLWPPDWLRPHAGAHAAVNSRPVVSLSLSLNYAWSGLAPRSYRVFNLAIHILNALLVYGLVKRTLRSWRPELTAAAPSLGLVCAALWLVHPLASQCINYAIQRTELLMAFFYLLALYASMRGADSGHSRAWHGAAVFACALGMASKEVMVTAPLMLLLYDRAFCAGSFVRAWRQRGLFYTGLAGTWAVLAALLWTNPHGNTVGSVSSAEAWNYALNQFGMIVQYLKLSFWPHPLVLDYGFPQPLGFSDVSSSVALVVALVAVAVFAVFRWPGCGFLGAWFFVVLAPTTSIVPLLNEVGAERRVYLSLAALIVLVVVGVYQFLSRRGERTASIAGGSIALGAVLLLGYTTIERNRDYQSEISIWRTVVEARPANPRGHNNLGKAYYEAGALDSAQAHYRLAVERAPHYPEAWNNLGLVKFHLGDWDGAVLAYERALEQDPRLAATWYHLGLAHQQGNDLEQAVLAYARAAELSPSDAAIWYNMGMAHKRAGAAERALESFAEVNRLSPDFADGWLETGRAHLHLGQVDRAVQAFERVLELRPGDREARAALREAR